MIRNKCLKALNILKFSRSTWWGADPSSLLMLYKSYVRSLIDHSYFVANVINTRHNYNTCLADFETLITNIDYDWKLGECVKQANNPNFIITDFVSQGNALAIYTDGSKMNNLSAV